MRHLRLQTVVAGLLLTGCATTGIVRTPTQTRRPSRRSDVLMRQEILDRAASAQNADDAVRLLRSQWTRPSGTTSFGAGTPIRFYIDNVAAGTIESMTAIPIERVMEIRHYPATEATARWGTGHTAGAIEVITGAGAARAARAAGQGGGGGGDPGIGVSGDPGAPLPEGTDPNDPQVFSQLNPFAPHAIYFVHGGTSMFLAPTEKTKVWRPFVNIGLGFGINATRSVSVFASAEYHRFQFSPEHTLAYMMDRSNGSAIPLLRDEAGVVISGTDNTIVNVSAMAKVRPQFGLIRPYLIGGVGYARLNSGTFTVSGEGGAPLPSTVFLPGTATGGRQIENAFSVSGGVGFDLRLVSDFRFFADVRYVEAVRGPRYNDVWDRNQLFNTQFMPFRFGLMTQ